MTPIEITREGARRFLLDLQGLRGQPAWFGREGARAAVEQLGYIQIDSISVVARSHDLTLWSRVEGYRPADLSTLLWQERALMEGQMPLLVLPVSDFPYVWARFLRPSAGIEREMKLYGAAARSALERVRQEGELSARDFQGDVRVPGGFSTQKEGVKGLELLWFSGALVTSRRAADFTRYYDLPERVYPGAAPADPREAAAHWARKSLRALGLATMARWNHRLGMWWRGDKKGMAEAVVKAGEAVPVRIEGVRSLYYVPADLAPRLASVGDSPGRLTFLAPLDNLIWDRSRLKELFNFDYRWEVYTPAAKRRWGYYTLPILYGTRLVGRLDPKMDRKAGALRLQGFWLEEAPELAEQPAFQTALAHRLWDFARFHGARQITAPEQAAPWLGQVVDWASSRLDP